MSDQLATATLSLTVLLLGAGIVGIFGMWGTIKTLLAKFEMHETMCEQLHERHAERLDKLEENQSRLIAVCGELQRFRDKH